MCYLALACDYDGTLAKDGHMSEQTIAALERVIASGRQVLLVTGRHLPNIQPVIPRLDLFAYVVAENGALLYNPATRAEMPLSDAPDAHFLQALRERDIPFVAGKVIVATWEPYDTDVLEIIRDLGLELELIYNKGAVMILPSGIHKGTGLKVALDELGISPRNVVAVGDAENDYSFFSLCGFSVAVANALPALKELADYTTQADHGDGVNEIIEQMLSDDLKTSERRK
jgi:phosphoglycolate phosphatase (TIGR01487 family)